MARPDLPLLWHFPISHFNEKVRWALDYKGIPHVRRVMGITYGPRAWLTTRQSKLPILFLNGKAIADSTRIIAALEHHKPNPSLYPRKAADRGRALDFEEFFDEELGHAVRAVIIGPSFDEAPLATIRTLGTGMPGGSVVLMKLGFPLFRLHYKRRHNINEQTMQKGLEQIARAIDHLRMSLQPNGYLVGDHFTIADLTAAALLSPLVGPTELEYAPPEPLPPSFSRLRKEFSGDPMFDWVRHIYQRHRGHSAEVPAA